MRPLTRVDMKTKQEIKDEDYTNEYTARRITIELLLDIRDLLSEKE